MVVTVEPGAYPGVDNTATVDSATPDTDPSGQLLDRPRARSRRWSTSRSPSPTATRSASATRRRTASTVVNHGPTADPGPVRVTDALPDGLTFVSATGDGWACTAAKGTVTCVDADGLAGGGAHHHHGWS